MAKAMTIERPKLVRTGITAKKSVATILRTFFIAGILYFILQPWIVLVLKSFMGGKDIYSADVFILPRHWSFFNFSYVWDLLDYSRGFFDSLWYAALNTLLQITSCSLVAYGFARFNFKFKKIIFSLVILTIVVPPTTVIINQYIYFLRFDFLGLFKLLGIRPIDMTKGFWVILLQSMTCMGIKNGVFIYLIRLMFERLPIETQEAAKIDGANSFMIFYKILVPSALPGIISAALLFFVWMWNDSFLISWFGSGKEVLIFRVNNIYSVLSAASQGYGQTRATMEFTEQVEIMLKNIASFLYLLPLILLFVFAQKHFVEGIERSGIVG